MTVVRVTGKLATVSRGRSTPDSAREISTDHRHMFRIRSAASKKRRPGGRTDNRASPKDADAPKETARSATHEM